MKKKNTWIIFVVALVFIMYNNAEVPKKAGGTGISYYVSYSSGSDSNPGTDMSAPIKTLQQVRKLNLMPGDSVLFKKGDTWVGNLSISKSGSVGNPITYSSYGTGPKPVIDFSTDASDGWTDSGSNIWTYPAPQEVGNIIFDDHKSFGVYRYNSTLSLTIQGDFAWNKNTRLVYLYSTMDPSAYYSKIELSTGAVSYSGGGANIDIRWNVHDVTIDGLRVEDGCRNGIAVGSNVNHIDIINNEIRYIGGCDMVYLGNPVRYGNAIQIWCNSQNIHVRNNTIWETWDAAMSPQCSTAEGAATMINHEYSYNTLWNNTYSFEYFASNISTISNISVHHNTFIDAGYGWGDIAKQPRGNAGRHFRLARTGPSTTNFIVKNNIVSGSKWKLIEVGMGSSKAWLGDLQMDNNLYYGGITSFVTWKDGKGYSTLASYQTASGQEMNSKFEQPNFLLNYKPLNGQSICNMSTTGSYVGAVSCDIPDFKTTRSKYMVGLITIEQFVSDANRWING